MRVSMHSSGSNGKGVCRGNHQLHGELQLLLKPCPEYWLQVDMLLTTLVSLKRDSCSSLSHMSSLTDGPAAPGTPVQYSGSNREGFQMAFYMSLLLKCV